MGANIKMQVLNLFIVVGIKLNKLQDKREYITSCFG